MIKSNQDHYAVLGLARNATAQEIKKAYRLMAKKRHPDRLFKDKAGDNPSAVAQAEEEFKAVAEAYRVLSNVWLRAEYDRSFVPRKAHAFRSEAKEKKGDGFEPLVREKKSEGFTPTNPESKGGFETLDQHLRRGRR